MADWVTISALATAGGTLALAGATYAATRSSNRSARIAELALQEQRRPLLVSARLDDPQQKIMFSDRHWVHTSGSQAVVEEQEQTLRAQREVFTIDLLYSDQVGGQRSISRFTISPVGDDAWLANVGLHWNLDAPSPR